MTPEPDSVEWWREVAQGLGVKAFDLRRQRDQLRGALVGLVGVDGRIELEQLEAVMRLMPAPAADKAATIDAIHALIATCGDTEQADGDDPVERSVGTEPPITTSKDTSRVGDADTRAQGD